MTTRLAILLVAGTVVPYTLPQGRLRPMTGASLWLAVLVLRGVLVVIGALVMIVYLPATQLFQLATHWCLHAVIPFFATHLGFSGHRIGDAAALLPGLVLGLSLVSALFALWRAAHAIHTWLRCNSLGAGPRESVVVGGADVVVAAAGIRRARVVVSTGALANLDEDELAAGLEHERGHVARHHPYISVIGSLAFALARLLPGSRDALDRFRFCLERDADEYAVDRTRDPMALASAICKAAAAERRHELGYADLADHGVTARLRLLLDRSVAKPTAAIELVGRGLVVALLVLTFFAAGLTPALAGAGPLMPSSTQLCES